MFEKYLQEIGLSDKEAKVYLALLEVDNDSIINISKKTNIKRSTVYVIVESLKNKGLVSEQNIGKKTHYHAEPPERLETFVERRKMVLEENTKRLKDIIPQIKSIQREGGEKPIIKVYEGVEGVLSSYESIYNENKKDIFDKNYLIYSRDLIKTVFNQEMLNKYRKKRISLKMNNKVIYTNIDGDLEKTEYSERIRLDEKKYPIYCDISVYGDEVMINTLRKSLVSIVIKSQDLADTLKSLINYTFDKNKDEIK